MRIFVVLLAFFVIGTTYTSTEAMLVIHKSSIPKERLISDLQKNRSELVTVDVEAILKAVQYKEYALEEKRLCYFFSDVRYWQSQPMPTSVALIYTPTENNRYKLDTVFSCYPDMSYLDSLKNKDYLFFENSVTSDNTVITVSEIVKVNDNGINRILQLESYDMSPKISEALSFRDSFEKLKPFYGKTIVNENKPVKHYWEKDKLISSVISKKVGVYEKRNDISKIYYTESTYTITY